MAENEYNFDNFLNDTTESSKSGSDQQKKISPRFKEGEGKEEAQKNTDTSTKKVNPVRLKARSGQTTPFAVQLHERDQEIIRAVCDAEGITQKRFIQYLIDGFLKGKKPQVRSAIKSYRAKNHKNKDSLLD